MTKKETAVLIDGKEIELKDWITSNQEKGLNQTAFKNVKDLGYILNDIIGVCACALNCIEEKANMNDFEKSKILGASPLEVANVLRFAQNLIPYPELELLSNLQKAIQES